MYVLGAIMGMLVHTKDPTRPHFTWVLVTWAAGKEAISIPKPSTLNPEPHPMIPGTADDATFTSTHDT